ncbi:IL6RA protein, partial [Atractosteus spatula]|nr:IL6RA protein [Atractosteus spatula]
MLSVWIRISRGPRLKRCSSSNELFRCATMAPGLLHPPWWQGRGRDRCEELGSPHGGHEVLSPGGPAREDALLDRGALPECPGRGQRHPGPPVSCTGRSVSSFESRRTVSACQRYSSHDPCAPPVRSRWRRWELVSYSARTGGLIDSEAVTEPTGVAISQHWGVIWQWHSLMVELEVMSLQCGWKQPLGLIGGSVVAIESPHYLIRVNVIQRGTTSLVALIAPERPTLSCSRKTPLSKIRCGWTATRPSTPIAHCRLIYKKGPMGKYMFQACSSSSSRRCWCVLDVEEEGSLYYLASLCAFNPAGAQTSPLLRFSIKPDPPRNVSAWEEEGSSCRLRVRWAYPSTWKNHFYKLKFEVQYQPVLEGEQLSVVSNHR